MRTSSRTVTTSCLRTLTKRVAYAERYHGEIYEVFDTNGQVVGYFATSGGFIDPERKDELLAGGYRLLRGKPPTP